MPRRDFIQLGIGGVLGLGFADVLRLRANASESATSAFKPSGKRGNCIMIWLDGGPSHYETFDPKPDAPAEVRGEFKPISTSVPGIQFCELLPRQAVLRKHSLDRFAKHLGRAPVELFSKRADRI